jgi:hypothetical protein
VENGKEKVIRQVLKVCQSRHPSKPLLPMLRKGNSSRGLKMNKGRETNGNRGHIMCVEAKSRLYGLGRTHKK